MWAVPALVLLLVVINTISISAHYGKNRDMEMHRKEAIKIRETHQKASQKLRETTEKTVEMKKSLRKEQSKLKKLKEENSQLKVSLQAKKDAEALNETTTVATTPQPVEISGNKETWLAQSGIPKHEWQYVDFIVSSESGWNPCAYNPGLSDCNANPTSACGLAQSLPCGKQSAYGHWTDPVANLKWQYEYVKGRYGGYAQAVDFWRSNHYY